MQAKFKLNVVFLLTISSILIGCEKKGTAVTFENICREENQKTVEITGFLYYAPNNLLAISNPDFHRQNLLVEKENGTGGFIEIEFENEEMETPIGEVKIIGKVSKPHNLCILKVEKIEVR